MRKVLLVVALILTGFVLRPAVINTPTPATKYVSVHHWHGVQVEQHVFMPEEAVNASVEKWKVEVARRFPDALLFVSHGNDIAGQWFVFPQDGPPVLARTEALRLKAAYPDRIIVFICCNPEGVALKVPGVYHAKTNVWFVPDKRVTEERPDEGTGNIFEFVDD